MSVMATLQDTIRGFVTGPGDLDRGASPSTDRSGRCASSPQSSLRPGRPVPARSRYPAGLIDPPAGVRRRCLTAP